MDDIYILGVCSICDQVVTAEEDSICEGSAIFHKTCKGE